MKESRHIEIIGQHFGDALRAFKERLIFDAVAACCPEKSTQSILSDNFLLLLADASTSVKTDKTSVFYKDTKFYFYDQYGDFPPHIKDIEVFVLYNNNVEELPRVKILQGAKTVFLIVDVTQWGKNTNEYIKFSRLYLRELNNWISAIKAIANHIQIIVLFCQPMIGWMSSDWRKYNADLFQFKGKRSELIDHNRKLLIGENFTLLLDLLLEHTPAMPILDGPLQMKIFPKPYDMPEPAPFGIVTQGKLRKGQPVFLPKTDGTVSNKIIRSIMIPAGIGKVVTDEAECGDCCIFTFKVECAEPGDIISEEP